MTPREPDRYREKAELLYAAASVGSGSAADIAAALRAVEAETLERAAGTLKRMAISRAADNYYGPSGDSAGAQALRDGAEMVAAQHVSPAAAPAAETEPPPGLVETLEKVHGMGCGNIATHRIPAPPSEPAPPSASKPGAADPGLVMLVESLQHESQRANDSQAYAASADERCDQLGRLFVAAEKRIAELEAVLRQAQLYVNEYAGQPITDDLRIRIAKALKEPSA